MLPRSTEAAGERPDTRRNTLNPPAARYDTVGVAFALDELGAFPANMTGGRPLVSDAFALDALPAFAASGRDSLRLAFVELADAVLATAARATRNPGRGYDTVGVAFALDADAALATIGVARLTDALALAELRRLFATPVPTASVRATGGAASKISAAAASAPEVTPVGVYD